MKRIQDKEAEIIVNKDTHIQEIDTLKKQTEEEKLKEIEDAKAR